MIKLLVVGTIVLLCVLLVWEITAHRATKVFYKWQVAKLMEILEHYGPEAFVKGRNVTDPGGASFRLVLPQDMKDIHIEGNVFENPPPPREKESSK